MSEHGAMKLIITALVGLTLFAAQACRSTVGAGDAAAQSAELPQPEIRYYVIADT